MNNPTSGTVPMSWKPLTGPGHIKQGDWLSFTVAGKHFCAQAKLIIDSGSEREEVVYNRKKNHYFLTAMAVDGTSNHKGVMVACAQPAAQAVDEYRAGMIAAQKICDRIAGDHRGRSDKERKGAGECSAAIRAALAAPVQPACKTCNGSRLVPDGAIGGAGGVAFENGPVECVKDCPDCAAPVQSEQEPVLIQAVAITREDDDEGLRLDWLLEGGISELELAGQVLFVMPEANDICVEDGSAHVYRAAPVRAVRMPERMRGRPFSTVDRGSPSYASGWNAALNEVARLNGESKGG